MNIRTFSGSDFDAAARLIGTARHAAHGKTSHWQGADELCAHLANADHGFVALGDKGELLGVVLVSSPREQDHNGTLRMHWLQQRTRIAAMAAALGINARADVDASAVTTQPDAGDATGGVLLLVVAGEAEGRDVDTVLLRQANAWLEERTSL